MASLQHVYRRGHDESTREGLRAVPDTSIFIAVSLANVRVERLAWPAQYNR